MLYRCANSYYECGFEYMYAAPPYCPQCGQYGRQVSESLKCSICGQDVRLESVPEVESCTHCYQYCPACV